MELKRLNRILHDETKKNLLDAGLFVGNMGMSFALYLHTVKLHVVQAELKADELMKNVVQQMTHISSPAFDRGLSGTGWAINFLHDNKCIDGDVDEILYNIDALVYRELTKMETSNEIGITNGFLGYFFYLTGRLSNVSHQTCTVQHRLLVEAVRITIDKLSDLMPGLLSTVSKDVYISVLWDIPLAFVTLSQVYQLGIYRDKIRNMVKCWNVHIPGAVPYFSTNKLYLAEALAYMNQELNEPYITKHVNLLLASLDINMVIGEIDYRIDNINEGWPFTVLLLHWAERLFPRHIVEQNRLDVTRRKVLAENLPRFERQLEQDSQTRISLSFINGLCGIAAASAVWPQAFVE